jgi:hypothetical protein
MGLVNLMDILPIVVKRLDELQQQIADNHLDVVQRVTKLEIKLADLPERVHELEKSKYHAAGVFATISAIVSAVLTWFKLKH